MNFQFRRRSSVLGSGLSATHLSPTRGLPGAFLRASPFRFSIDQSKQAIPIQAPIPASTVAHRSIAAYFDQKIVNGLTFSGLVSKDRSSLGMPGRPGNEVSAIKVLQADGNSNPGGCDQSGQVSPRTDQEFGGC